MFKKRLGEKLGAGGEKEVFVNQENPEHAIGIFSEYSRKETPQQIKGRFYLTKILHLLFPKQIPDMHLASTDPHMIEVDRISVDRCVPGDTFTSKEPCELRDKIKDVSGVFIDYFSRNFVYDKEGNLIYLDSVDPFQGDKRYYDPEKIKVALEKLEDDKKERGLVFLKRLEELYKEELASVQNKENDKEKIVENK